MVDWILVGKVVYDLALAVTACVAWRWGGLDERIGAVILVAGSGISALAPTISRLFHFPVALVYGSIDIAILIVLDRLAMRSRSWWPIWVEGFQLAAIAIHVGMALWPVTVRPYLLLQGKFAYPMLIALVAGCVRRRRSSKLTALPQMD